MELPDGARRLFGETGAAAAPELAADAPDPYLLARLLEDGDRADLAWLCGQLPRGALAAWVERHGPRRLSRRSLAFWAVVLDRPDLKPELLPELERRRQLWPL